MFRLRFYVIGFLYGALAILNFFVVSPALILFLFLSLPSYFDITEGDWQEAKDAVLSSTRFLLNKASQNFAAAKEQVHKINEVNVRIP